MSSCSHLDEAGSTVVEAVVLIPMAMLVVLFAVQMCIWAHAATLAENAATEGEIAATVAGGSDTAGVSRSEALLGATAAHIVVDPKVDVTRLPGEMVQIQVTGSAESIIPGLRFPVSAVRVGELQEFRASG